MAGYQGPKLSETNKTPQWEIIAGLINGKTVDDCKIQWNHLRNTFREKYKIIVLKPSGAEAKQARKWCWFDRLFFLRDVFAFANTVDSTAVVVENQEEGIEQGGEIEEGQSPDTTPAVLNDEDFDPRTPASTSSATSNAFVVSSCLPESSGLMTSQSSEKAYVGIQSSGKKRKKGTALDKLLADMDKSNRVDAENTRSLVEVLSSSISTSAKEISDEELFGKWVTTTLQTAEPAHRPKYKRQIREVIAKLALECLEEYTM
ncbi:uncharacterized protein LOC129592260 [Paramacrobiotus metropolitanus]|uniref:uncharacterized protein LOC129592260 n=1 Tax=Paramacrobiotus metropolitanus TaxID=2943436 RepID=UPI002446083A|nr:uncharacterized protein LOC129592260 [Paramacrobiotus metropolitanus]